MRLAGKVALVTGSSRGIGREIAVAMARAGADIVINYSRSKDAAETAAEEIKRLGRQALAVQASVTERSQVERLIGCAVEKFGRLDVLVNNAGGFPIKPFAMVTDGRSGEYGPLCRCQGRGDRLYQSTRQRNCTHGHHCKRHRTGNH